MNYEYGSHITVEDLRKSLLREKRDKNNLRAEQVREQLDPQAILTQLFEVLVATKSCDPKDVPALTLRSNVLLAILKKCLPDLKQLEIKGISTKAHTLTIDMSGKYDRQITNDNSVSANNVYPFEGGDYAN